MMIRLASGGSCHAASIAALTAAQQGTPKSADADNAVSIPSAIPGIIEQKKMNIARLEGIIEQNKIKQQVGSAGATR